MKENPEEAFRIIHNNMLRTLEDGRKLETDAGGEIDSDIMNEFLGNETSFLILDGGCGSGRSSLGLAKMGHSIICVDALPEAVRLAKLIYHEAEVDSQADFVICDIRCLPFLKKTFDVVFSGGVLEHFLYIEKPLKEFFRVLKKEEGVLAATVPNIFSGFAVFDHILNPKRLLYWLDKEKRMIYREKLFTVNEAVENIERNGFQAVKIVPFRLDMSLPHILPSRFSSWILRNQPIHKMFNDLALIFPRFYIGFSWFFIFAQKSSLNSTRFLSNNKK